MLPSPQNGALTTAVTSYGTIVVAFCIKGYMFPEVRTDKSLRCAEEASGGKIEWNDTVTDCRRKRQPCSGRGVEGGMGWGWEVGETVAPDAKFWGGGGEKCQVKKEKTSSS